MKLKLNKTINKKLVKNRLKIIIYQLTQEFVKILLMNCEKT